MRKKILIALAVLVLLVLFLPVPVAHILYGNGEILNLDKEKVGECQLTITLEELSSLAVIYKKSFTFNLDGADYEDFESHSWMEGEDGPYQISQMFYDGEEDGMSMCSLIYDEDLSYAVVRTEDYFYLLNIGADISYRELPVA